MIKNKAAMDQEYINITENDKHKFTVEAKLINQTLWLSKWQMATLFNVYTKTIESSLNAIFKAGLLQENKVSRTRVFVNDGRESEQTTYNLDTLILVGFRIASLEAKAFREWVFKAFSDNVKQKNNKSQKVLIVLNSHLKTPITTSLN